MPLVPHFRNDPGPDQTGDFVGQASRPAGISSSMNTTTDEKEEDEE
jgi:hypothetical protein